MLKSLLNPKNLKAVGEAVEKGVEKITQYGTKTLKVMKPQKETLVHVEGIGRVPEAFVAEWTATGRKVLGKETIITKDAFLTDAAGNVNLLRTTIAPNRSGQLEKSLSHVINYGTSNARQNLLHPDYGFVRGYTGGKPPITPMS